MAKEKKDFVNPFEKGVNYEEFLKAVNDSKKTVSEYCKSNLDSEQIEILENDLKYYKQNKN